MSDRVTLAEFLADLDKASAAEARAAAARIDELAKTGAAIEGIERRFWPFAGLAGAAFVAGIVFLVSPGMVPRWLTVLCLAALPIVVAVYARRVLARTRADRAAEALNIRHFLPNGGIYFAAGKRPAGVVRVPPQTDARKPVGVTCKDMWW